MDTVFSPDHRLRDAKTELYGGQLVAPFECPRRAELVLEAVESAGLGAVLPPTEHDLASVLRVHDAGFVSFLATAWQDWRAAGFAGEAIPAVLPVRRTRIRPGRDVESRLGYYAMAAETSISAGTYEAALVAKDVALSATALIQGGHDAAFALCRPPGHHAMRDMFGGYCFLNNAAIAAQALRDGGCARVAVLDVDFHHGNGTQDIFYHRGDVLVVSLHGDPEDAFPHFTGFADERGEGPGDGFNLNLPLPRNTDWAAWSAALDRGLRRIDAFGPDAVVVSLGVDTYADDPIGFFTLGSADFRRMGERLGKLRRPTAFVLEGGYAVDVIGQNVVAVLAGHAGA
ncbi:MAG: histone deacetylase family protein [Pseudomonadota bacterium]